MLYVAGSDPLLEEIDRRLARLQQARTLLAGAPDMAESAFLVPADKAKSKRGRPRRKATKPAEAAAEA